MALVRAYMFSVVEVACVTSFLTVSRPSDSAVCVVGAGREGPYSIVGKTNLENKLSWIGSWCTYSTKNVLV